DDPTRRAMIPVEGGPASLRGAGVRNELAFVAGIRDEVTPAEAEPSHRHLDVPAGHGEPGGKA
ncbi:hypothetical protein AAER41_04265, partial [Pseudomonas aeruginosa]